MIFLGALSMLIAILVGSAIGWRLVRVARHTGGSSEAILGRAFIAIFGLTYPLIIVSRLPGMPTTLLGKVLFGLALLPVVFGLGSFYVFTRRVFRPHSAWARAFLWLASLAALGVLAGSLLTIHGAPDREALIAATRPWALAILLLAAVPFVWTAAESLAWYARMRRRAIVGLADPLTTNRFLLWGLAAIAAVSQVAVMAAFRVAGWAVMDALPMTVSCGTTLLTLGLWYLAFIPPAWYRRRLGAT